MEKEEQPLEPEMECIEVASFEEQLKRVQKMSELSKMHNQLAKDFEALHVQAKEPSVKETLIQPQIRAVIKEMFSLIESDLYLINQFNSYEEYHDKDSLVVKFKKTYKHHGKTFKKEHMVNEFLSRNFEHFVRIKEKRDELMHPKGVSSINVSKEELKDTYAFYQLYRAFVLQMMTNSGFSSRITLF